MSEEKRERETIGIVNWDYSDNKSKKNILATTTTISITITIINSYRSIEVKRSEYSISITIYHKQIIGIN